MERIASAIKEAKDERNLGFDARIIIYDDFPEVKIETRISRDPRRSSNGGEYHHWLRLRPNPEGRTLAIDRCSCDFWQPEDEP